jgi:hypothetical protein
MVAKKFNISSSALARRLVGHGLVQLFEGLV